MGSLLNDIHIQIASMKPTTSLLLENDGNERRLSFWGFGLLGGTFAQATRRWSSGLILSVPKLHNNKTHNYLHWTFGKTHTFFFWLHFMVFLFFVGGPFWRTEQWSNPGWLGCIGDYSTRLSRDFMISHIWGSSHEATQGFAWFMSSQGFFCWSSCSTEKFSDINPLGAFHR